MSNTPAPHRSEDRAALILVVERNPMVQRLERFFLEQAGYSVEFTSDGLTALARAQELRPAILVTLRILKTRGSAHDNREHEIQITNKSVMVKEAKNQG